ncbi:hypothetical protein [Amaricoccus solimangrovi]|uniref:DUF2497 domain-containing protein n=1 Tax=Amaricoccus solimangrovi TaxID=2589815 RepID=A0A501WV53_9RHOB|nr:hypothetical protein [Amaricoccus solimangrovi]TPE53159.1 hypothetical protein FJM51_03815 [Amaricoccus solimangrovi]
MSGDEDRPDHQPEDQAKGPNRQALSEVLASIRALVSAETSARMHEPDEIGEEEAGEGVLMLTPDMRVDARAAPGRLAEGAGLLSGAPILDEEGLRRIVNEIVREELRGEFGERISRDLRRMVRREVEEALRAERGGD